ncbi:hypothetical protein H2201_009025, partial [Coniosporium apollinis]
MDPTKCKDEIIEKLKNKPLRPATSGAPPGLLPELNLPEPSISIDEPDTVSDSLGEVSAAAPRQALSRIQPLAEYLDLQVFSKASPSTLFGRDKPQTPFDAAQPWSGAIYIYQPEKHLFSVEIIAHTIAFFIIWYTPTVGLTCRHFPVFGIFGVWLLSRAFTSLSYRFMTGVYHWRLTIAKDTVITFPALAM